MNLLLTVALCVALLSGLIAVCCCIVGGRNEKLDPRRQLDQLTAFRQAAADAERQAKG